MLRRPRSTHYEASEKLLSLSHVCETQFGADRLPSRVKFFNDRATIHLKQAEKQRKISDRIHEDIRKLKAKVLDGIEVVLPLRLQSDGVNQLTVEELCQFALQKLTAEDIGKIHNSRDTA